MSTSLAAIAREPSIDPKVVEQVLLKGDLRQLTAEQKIAYYRAVCESIGLNPLTQPFAYIVLNGKEVLYAKREATEQLRKLHGISIDPKTFIREVIEGVYVVTAAASTPGGRTDVSTGAVAIDGLKGETRANAMLKAETKAKRRVTLSICGLGMLDETEVETIPQAVVVEAPKPLRLPPTGYMDIVRTEGRTYGGDLTVLDEHGAETMYPVPDRQCFELAEQIAQEGTFIKLTLVKGVRDGKVKVKAIERWKSPEQIANAQIDKELVAKEADVL